MIYKIENQSLKTTTSNWNPKELEIEKFILSFTENEYDTLDSKIFGEQLLIIKNQVKTHNNKRADILALDSYGNGVIIEIKRTLGSLGVEMQALQYISEFSKYTGKSFIEKFQNEKDNLEEKILSFIGANTRIEDINKNSRIILLARQFDPILFSMGEWLSENNIAFKCVEYFPIEISLNKYISFSIAFDRSPKSIFPITFKSVIRDPQYFWHNIASATQDWWEYLINNNEIPACFDNSPGDQGERLLKNYITGDTIIAYAKGFGAIGYGIIEDPTSYRLIEKGSKGDKLNGGCLHRIKVRWLLTTKNLSNGILPNFIRDNFNIYHPLSTSVTIEKSKAKDLIKYMKENFT